MPEAAADPKSPKTPRRLKTGGEPLRQVHFHSKNSSAATQTQHQQHQQQPGGSNTAATSSSTTTTTTTTATPTAENNQPASFPQLGAPPNSSLGAGQWHTSADPTQSVKLPGQPFAGPFAAGFTPAPQNAHFLANPLPVNIPAPVTYIGLQHPQHFQHLQHLQHLQQPLATVNMAADYQNAAPFPTGVNFQPPVPDTTFGPMPHVYVPRFDGGFVPAAVQQPTVAGISVAQPSYVVAQQPAVLPQPMAGQQPFMIQGQPMMAPGQPMMAPVQSFQAMPPMGMGGGVPVIAGNGGQIPDVSGLGRTPVEETVRQLHFAQSNKMFEPQEFKPSDDDPSRFYYVREVDGNWTQRNRFTIDHLGDCRWYVTDEGWFYAVRLPS